MLRNSLCNRSSETFATTLNNSPQSLPSWDAALKETPSLSCTLPSNGQQGPY